MKNLKVILFLFLSQNALACCGEINYSLFSILHDKGTKYTAFMVYIEQTTTAVDFSYKSYAKVIANYSNTDTIQHIEILTGGNSTAGGQALEEQKYYFVLGYEFERGKYWAFVCDVHSKRLSDNADSSLIITKMLDYKKHQEQKYTGKVKYFDNTILLAEGTLKKGIPNGQWKYYGREGNLIAETNYKMGNRIGLERQFDNSFLTSLHDKRNKNRIIEQYVTDELGKKYLISINKFDKKGYCISVHYNYYQNGNLRMKSMSFRGASNYLSSFYIGDFEEYTEDGKIIAKGKYDRGAKVGIWLEQNPKDSSLETKIYPNIKTKKGIFTWFQANGVKSVEGVLDKKGKQDIWVQYNEKGDTLYFGKYVNDREQGNWKYFYANKNVESIRKFVDGKEDGAYTRFYENGIIESEGTFKAGNIYGEWKTYDTDGKLKNITHYNEKGEQHGEDIIYAQDGKVLRNITYINNYIDGDYVFYAENGNIIEKGTYDHGIKIGEWLRYKEDGTLIQRCVYPKQQKKREEVECFEF